MCDPPCDSVCVCVCIFLLYISWQSSSIMDGSCHRSSVSINRAASSRRNLSPPICFESASVPAKISYWQTQKQPLLHLDKIPRLLCWPSLSGLWLIWLTRSQGWLQESEPVPSRRPIRVRDCDRLKVSSNCMCGYQSKEELNSCTGTMQAPTLNIYSCDGVPHRNVVSYVFSILAAELKA